MKDSKKEVKISTPVGIILIIVALITGVICFCLGTKVAKIEDNKTTSKKEVITEKKENETTTTKKIVEDNESDKNQTNSNEKNEIDSYATVVKINGKEEEAVFYKANSLEIITTRDKEGDDKIYSFKIGDKTITYYDNDKNKIINGFNDYFSNLDIFKNYYLVGFYADGPVGYWYYIIYDNNGNEIFNNKYGLNKDGSKATKKYGAFTLDNYTKHENDNLINFQYTSKSFNNIDFYNLTKSDCNTIKKNNVIGKSLDIIFEEDRIIEKETKQLHFNEIPYYVFYTNKCKEVGVNLN